MTKSLSPASLGPIARFLQQTSLGPRQQHERLALWPLLLRPDAKLDPSLHYITLADALANGRVEIEELKSGPTVPHILVRNRGAEDVLVLFGEELRGAMQNRIANASFVVPAGQEVVIDVSCVESGRWRPEGRGMSFSSSGHTIARKMKRRMSEHVKSSLSERDGRFDANQREVWDGVHSHLAASRVHSRTLSYSDFLERWSDHLDAALQAFTPRPGQVGFVAGELDGERAHVTGIEIVSAPEAFARAMPALVRGYVSDLFGAGDEETRVFEDPAAFLEALGEARVEERPSLGAGTDLRITGERVGGCAVATSEIVHLTGYVLAETRGRGAREPSEKQERMRPGMQELMELDRRMQSLWSAPDEPERRRA